MADIDLLASLAAAEAKLLAGIVKGADRWGKETAEYAQQHHAFVNRSGETEASVRGGVTEITPEKIVIAITADGAAKPLETTHGGRHGTEAKGEALPDGSFIRTAWAFLTPAVHAREKELLPTIAEETKGL